MKVTFGQTFDNVPPTKLSYLLGSYLQVPKMTNEQVKKANQERQLPDDFYIHAFVPNSARGNSQRTITITKGMPKVHYGQEFITQFLPKGLVVENIGNRTYLKEEGVSIKEQNYKYLTILGLLGAGALGMYCAKKSIDVFI
ncbi:MAG: hypothetical protein KIC80_02790 [Brachyspira sp.]|jgi:hypothetical protein|nr:hypothetical protein [Brachyspira sp.]